MIIDSHIHLGRSAATPCVDKSISAVLSLMDHLGIDKGISADHSLLFGRPEAGFQRSVRAYEESEGRILNYTYFSPHYPEQDLEMAKRHLEHEAFVGIKIHPVGARCYPDDERWDPIWKLASDRGVPLLTHSWWVSDYNPAQRFATPDRFEYYVERYPDVDLILGHAGWRRDGNRAAAELARSHPSVYVDLSGDIYWFGLVEWFVEQIGADRMLFGSDLTMMDVRTTMGRILDAGISWEEKALILGENAVRIFALGSKVCSHRVSVGGQHGTGAELRRVGSGR